MGRREERKEEKRQKILNAAREVFLEKGYHNSSISDIIRKTDLARGTFYLYFQDKQEIFDSLVTDLFLSLSKDIYNVDIEQWKDEGELKREIQKVVRSLLTVLEEQRELVKIVLFSTTGLDTDFDRKVANYHKLMVEVIKLMIQRGQQAHNWKAHDPGLLAHLVYGGIKEFAFQWLVGDAYSGDLEKETTEIISIFLDGIGQA